MRSDYLNENSGATNGHKKKVEKITAARTLTNDDSGKVFMLDSAGGAYSITLPTASSAEEGIYYKFIVEEETPTADITIAAGSAIISLVTFDGGNTIGNSTAGTQVSNILVEAASQKADYLEIMFTNGEYVASGMSSINDGFTTS